MYLYLYLVIMKLPRIERDLGREAKTHGGNSPATRGGLRRDGRRGEGRRRHRRCLLTEEDSSLSESQRGSPHVRMFDILYQGRLHEDRQRRSEHPARRSALRTSHSQRTLRLRESRKRHHADTKKGRSDLRKWQGGRRTGRFENWLACHSR